MNSFIHIYYFFIMQLRDYKNKHLIYNQYFIPEKIIYLSTFYRDV